MILIGTDIVKVFRIKALIDNKEERFLNKVFTQEENLNKVILKILIRAKNKKSCR